jgi:hypothetical protein
LGGVGGREAWGTTYTNVTQPGDKAATISAIERIVGWIVRNQDRLIIATLQYLQRDRHRAGSDPASSIELLSNLITVLMLLEALARHPSDERADLRV